jgi:hypothetical protein
MSYYQENRPAMGGLADALAMQGRRGDSTLVHMNPMEVRMLETMSPDGRLSINPETGLPEAFKLKDVAAFALPIAASIAFPMLAPAGLTAALGGVGTAAVGAGLGGFGAGLLQGKGVGDSLIQGGLSGLMSYGLGSAFAPAVPTGGVTATPSISPEMALSGASVAPDAASLATFNATQNAAAGNTPGLFARLGDSVTGAAQTPLMPETLSSIAPEGYAASLAGGAAPTYGSALTAGGSGLLSSALLAPEEMPYDIAGMDDMDAYYASRIPDLEAGRRRGRAAARSLNYPPSGSTSSQYYGMATSPGGFGTFYAADGGQVPGGALGSLPPHVARGLMENPEIGTDAAAFSNLVNSQPSPKNLMGRLPGALGNLPPHVARGLMQNPEIGRDAATFSKLVNTQPSPKDLMGGRLSGAFGYLPPHVARGLMQNPEIGRDAAAFSNLVTGKASGIQTDQISNLDANRLRGQAAARSLNYPLSGGSAADYYRMATSPGGFGTFYAADGGQVPKPYGDPYGPGDPYGGMSDESNSGQSSSTGQSSGTPGSVDTSGFMSSLGDPIDIGLGIGNPSPIGLGASLAGLTLGIPALGPAVAIGRGIASLMGPSVPGQVSGFGTTTGGPTGIGIGVTGQGVDPSFEAVSNPDFDMSFDFNPSIGDATGVSGDTSGASDTASTAGAEGDAAGESTADAGGWAQGGVIRRQDGGDLTADDLYGEATVTGIQRRLPTQQFVPSQSRGVQESLASMFPNFTVAPANQIQQSGMTLADVGRLKELMKSGPAAFRLLGMIGMAQGGGISSLAYGGEAAPVGFANKAFEGMVPGQGTGMSDDIPFSIEGNQPALLSRDEYVLPADVVSQLGDGSSGAGADMLDNFISQVRQTKYGNTQQPAPVGPQLMTGLMKQGGVV